ncbi:MAG: hypothetical protein R3F59_10525 [Myxococcota bacterium]
MRSSLLLTLALAPGCAPHLDPGSWGTFRYFSDVLGTPPMRLVPPTTDRDGNVYVLAGAADYPATTVYVGRLGGGWTAGCTNLLSDELYGVHGFVGRSDDRAWFWSGTALVEVDGATGACSRILRQDPVSRSQLTFLGVAPLVDETPSRRFTYALVRGETGTPQFLMVDLDEWLPFNTTPFPDEDADDIRVVGTGARPHDRQSVFLVAWGQGDDQLAAVLTIDRYGKVADTVGITLPTDIEAWSLQGYLQFSDDGVGAGLLSDGSVVIVTKSTAERGTIDQIDVGGVLVWDGKLFLSGLDGNDPALVPVQQDGKLGDVQAFPAAAKAADGLQRAIQVSDERSKPARDRTWDDPRTAFGEVPLVSPWPLDVYTTWSTGWLVAGPDYASGVEPVTAVAFAPVGMETP